MLNPFLLPVKQEKRRRPAFGTEETTALLYGHSVDSASPRPHMGLWIGRLLIRMGEMLTKQESEIEHTKERE